MDGCALKGNSSALTVDGSLNLKAITAGDITYGGMGTVLGGGTIVVMSEDPRYDYDNNRITATMLVATAPGEVISYTFTISDDVQMGEVLVPVWNGKQLARYRYVGPGRYIRTVSETTTTARDSLPIYNISYPPTDKRKNERMDISHQDDFNYGPPSGLVSHFLLDG